MDRLAKTRWLESFKFPKRRVATKITGGYQDRCARKADLDRKDRQGERTINRGERKIEGKI